jgi:hypothetical protein
MWHTSYLILLNIDHGTHNAQLTRVSDCSCNKWLRTVMWLFIINVMLSSMVLTVSAGKCMNTGQISILPLCNLMLCYRSGLVQRVHMVNLVRKLILQDSGRQCAKCWGPGPRLSVFLEGNVYAQYLPNLEGGWWQLGYVGTYSSIRFGHTIFSQCET